MPYHQAFEEGFEDMRRRIPEMSTIRKLVGFHSTLSLIDIVRQVMEHYSNNIKDGLAVERVLKKQKFSVNAKLPIALTFK